jgi:chromosomal replication initiation ATPase DnaA
MTQQRIVETFNTHRMLPHVIRELATGRDDEAHEVLNAIRGAAAHAETPPQHVIVYGERGSGKSFLMRVVEIDIQNLARDANIPITCVLLPEEQYNIKSAPQILEAVAAKDMVKNNFPDCLSRSILATE